MEFPQIPRHFSQRSVTFPLELMRSDLGDDCNAAIAAGRVLQSFRGFLPKAVTQTQSSLFPPLTAFR